MQDNHYDHNDYDDNQGYNGWSFDWNKFLKILICVLLVTAIVALWQVIFLRGAAWEYYKQYSDILGQFLFV